MNPYASPRYLEGLRRALANIPSVGELRGSRVLVTGACGLLGSSLVDILMLADEELGLEVEVVASGRSLVRLRDRYDGCRSRGRLHFAEIDVRDPIDMSGGADYIVHAASNAHPAAISGDYIGTTLANVDGAANLVSWGGRVGARRMLYVSSGEVYGQMPPGAGAFSEREQGYVDPTSPRSCYPLSKRLAENVCASSVSAGGPECVIARPCHTFGAPATSADSRAHEQFLRMALDGRDVVLNSLGEQERSYAYAPDVASAFVSLLTVGGTGEAYNVSTRGGVTTVAGLAESIATACGVGVRFNVSETPDPGATPITHQVLDPAKIEALGWRPAFSPEDAIEDVVAVRREMRGKTR